MAITIYNPSNIFGEDEDINLGAGAVNVTGADSGYDWLTGTGATGTTKAMTDYQKALLAQKAAETNRMLSGGQNAYNYTVDLLNAARAPFAGELEQIGQQETQQQEFVKQQSANLLKQIADRLSMAQATTTAGYGGLQRYLEQNQPQAFQEAQRVMPVITQNALAQYMQAQGASPAAVQPELNRVNAQAAGSAANYNSLLNVLGAAQQAAQQSRLSEAQMAGTLAGQQLQNIYGAQTSGVEQAQLQALANIVAQAGAARLRAEQERRARAQALENALAALLARGYVSQPVAPPTGGGTEDDTTTKPSDSGTVSPQAALDALRLLAPIDPNAPAPLIQPTMPSSEEVARLIALAQQSPQYTGGGAGGFGGLGTSNVAVMV